MKRKYVYLYLLGFEYRKNRHKRERQIVLVK